jgi:hypothetical protein
MLLTEKENLTNTVSNKFISVFMLSAYSNYL